jgi:chromosome segregation ATPase
MNMITSILARLPKAKTSADFDAAISELEKEFALARAAVGELEAQREDTIFAGGDLDRLDADVGAAENRAKTLAVALEGATKRRDQAMEAEAQAALEATARDARKLNAKLTASLIGFANAADEMAGHADEIKRLREKIDAANKHVRVCGRSDLAIDDPVSSLPEITGRLVHDPMAGLNVPEFWPRTRHDDGPALLKLRK